jgi:hypothetical protein
MCQTVLVLERLVHAITASRNFVAGTAKQKADRMRFKDLVSNENFVGLLHKALALLSPIDAFIVKYRRGVYFSWLHLCCWNTSVVRLRVRSPLKAKNLLIHDLYPLQS